MVERKREMMVQRVGGLPRTPRWPRGPADIDTREILRFYMKISDSTNSGLTLEFCLLAGIGRSGVMIGSLCLNMVTKFPQGSEL